MTTLVRFIHLNEHSIKSNRSMNGNKVNLMSRSLVFGDYRLIFCLSVFKLPAFSNEFDSLHLKTCLFFEHVANNVELIIMVTLARVGAIF